MATKTLQIKDFVESSLVGRISRTKAALLNRVEGRLAAAGIDLSAERGQLLLVIGLMEGINQRGIADELGTEQTTISRQLDGLVAAGLVERYPSPTSRREWKLQLTRKGRALFERTLPLAVETIQNAQLGVSPEEMKTCLKVLDQMIQNLTGPEMESPPSRRKGKRIS